MNAGGAEQKKAGVPESREGMSRRKGCRKHTQKRPGAGEELAGERGDGLVRVSRVSESHAFISGVRKQAVVTKPVSNRNQPRLLKSPCWKSKMHDTKGVQGTVWNSFLHVPHTPSQGRAQMKSVPQRGRAIWTIRWSLSIYLQWYLQERDYVIGLWLLYS